ncbi:MAG: class E sortase [Solirubrobacterales bacterium]|nr:class E sortase [Solirubrobacterales bacterium]
MITAGLIVTLDAGLTLVWQEPVSAAYGAIQQARAGDELAELEQDFPTQGDLQAINGVTGEVARARALAKRFSPRISQGDAIGRIKIAGIGLDMVLLQGTDTATLQHGPGHYETTPYPGQAGTVGVAGHRTTYLAPFRKINEIEDGQEIELKIPYATFFYKVQKHEVVDPTDVQIVDPAGYQRLVLTACHPLYSAAQRWAVFARLRRIEDVGGA